MKLIRKTVEITDKEGLVKHYTNFYLVFENGNYVPVKPSFKNDYKVMYVLATPEERKGE